MSREWMEIKCTEWCDPAVASGGKDGEGFLGRNGDSSVSSALESLQCCPRPGKIKLNIKTFMSRSRKVPEQLETSQAAPGCKGCCHFAAVTTSLLFPFKGWNWEIPLGG